MYFDENKKNQRMVTMYLSPKCQLDSSIRSQDINVWSFGSQFDYPCPDIYDYSDMKISKNYYFFFTKSFLYEEAKIFCRNYNKIFNIS